VVGLPFQQRDHGLEAVLGAVIGFSRQNLSRPGRGCSVGDAVKHLVQRTCRALQALDYPA